MNYNNIKALNQRQFDIVMKREGVLVSDYYNTDTTYTVFFRRGNRSITPEGAVKLYYAQNTPIKMGTVFSINGENYVVVSQDGSESNVYYTSVANRCDTVFTVNCNSKYVQIPFVTDTKQYTVADNNVISVIDGSVTIYTGYNDYVKNMNVGNRYSNYGGNYSVQNYFYNNNLAYIYLEREANSNDTYLLTYTGKTELDWSDGKYQLEYTALKNGNVVDTPALTYSVNDESLATVDSNGLLEIWGTGDVIVTATWTDGNVSCDTTITIGKTVTKSYTCTVSGRTDLKVGYSRTYTATVVYNELEEDETANATFVWSVDKYADSITLTPSTNTCKAIFDNEDLIGEEVVLTATATIDGVVSIGTITVTLSESF